MASMRAEHAGRVQELVPLRTHLMRENGYTHITEEKSTNRVGTGLEMMIVSVCICDKFL